jgi:hypothetical protein
MTPESESDAGIDVFTGGNQSRIGGAGTGIVATIRPGGSATTDGAESVAPTAEGSEANPAAQPDPNAPAAAGNSAGGTTATGTADTAAKADTPNADGSTAKDGTQKGANGGSTKESTSKKKKGLRKAIPW